MSIWARFRAAAGAFLIANAMLASSAATAQLKTDPDEALLFSVQLGTTALGSSVRGFNTRAGVCLDLQDTIDTLQIAINVDAKAGTASGWAFQESRRIMVDRPKRQVTFGGQSAALTDDTIWESRSGWCVRAVDLGKWLSVDFDIDRTNAVLSVRAKGALPIEAAIRRAALASRLQNATVGRATPLPRVSLPYRPWRAPWIDANFALAANRDPGQAFRMAQGYEIYAAGELAYFSADARLVSTQNFKPDSLRLRLYRTDPDARLLGRVRATQLAIGDVAGFSTPLVAQSALGRGVTITNRPLARSNEFDVIDFTGAVAVGWDVELYRNGELIGATRPEADGRYAFRRVAMRFGTNIFEITSYGPQGQVRRETKIYNIAQQSVPPGETWWWADAVQQGRDLIEFKTPLPTTTSQSGWRQDVGFEHGFGRGFSGGAALHRQTGPLGQSLFVDGTLRGGVGPALTQIDVAHAFGGGASARIGVLGQAFGTSFSLEALSNRGLNTEQLSADLKSRVRLALDKPVRLGGLVLPVHFDLARTLTIGGSAIEARSRISAALPGLSASLTAGWQKLSPLNGRAETAGTVGLLFSTRLRGVRVRGEAQWSVKSRVELANVQVAANLRAGQAGAMEASASYAPGLRTASFGGSYTRDFGRFALTAGADTNTQGQVGARLNVLVGFGPGKGWGRLSSKPRAGSGGVAVTLFRDDNGDGRRDPGEAPVPGGIQVDGTPIAIRLADKARIAPRLVEGLDPSAPVKIAVDASSLADPFDVPATAGVMVVPRAGMITPVELGVVGTGSVEGKLTDANGVVAGELIELVDSQGIVRRVRSEFDGYFIFEGVRYGHYRLRSKALVEGREIEIVLSADRPSSHVNLRRKPA